MAFSMGRFVRRFIDREPVVSFSIAISVFGLSMPFWVTPMREAAGLQVGGWRWVGSIVLCVGGWATAPPVAHVLGGFFRPTNWI